MHPRQAPTLINDGTALTGWTAASGGTRAVASITDYRGQTINAMKMTATAANTTTNLDFTITGQPFSSFDALVFDMYVDFQTWASLTGASTGGDGAFLLGNSSFTSFWTWQVNLTMGWNRIVLHPSNVSATTGTPAWTTAFFSGASTLRFRITARSGYTGTFYISNLSFTGQTLRRATLCLHFDDARAGVYDNAFPLMKARGLVGTVGVIGSQIGQAGYMTAAQLRELQAAGWSMFNHSNTHGAQPFMIGDSQASDETEITDCRNAMIAAGLNGYDRYAAPYGEWDTNYFAALNAQGIKINRGLIDATGYKTSPHAERIVAGCLMPCVQIVNGTSAATALVWIDAAITTKSLQILLLHDILAVGSGTPPAIATSVFTTLVDGLQTRVAAQTLDVMNWDQWMEVGGLKYARVGYP